MSLSFEEPDITRFKEYKELWLKCDEYSSDMSFVIIWAWKDCFGYEMARDGDLFWTRQTKPDLKWLAPAGDWHRGDWAEQLMEHVGPEAEFVSVPKALVNIWREQLGSRITAEEDLNSFEYLYHVEELATLAGHKYIKKRNRVNKFCRQYDASYLTLTPELTARVKDLQSSWTHEENEYMTEILAAEGEGLLRVLDHWQEFGLIGAAIELDGQLIAYTLAEPVNDEILQVHYEKGLPEYPEAYAVINKFFLANDGRRFKVANREEDMGDPGLRHAKLSYMPFGFVEKYRVKWKADA